jgi:uncharacterized surface protein with fasciclin (FAS1) repeats
MKSFGFVISLLLVASFLLVGCAESTPPTETADQPGQGPTDLPEQPSMDVPGQPSMDMPEQPPTDVPEQPGTELADIVDTAVAADGFQTLVAAVKAAGLVETLKGEGPFTVFAPTDEAFANLPEGTLDDLLKPESKDKLTAILTYHVVPGQVMAADVVNLTSAKTVQGGEVAIAVDNGNVKVDEANVTATDIQCTNGVIHVIDAVILPE